MTVTPNLLKTTETVLVIIDMQDKLLNGIKDKNKLITNINTLIKAAEILNLEVICTVQNPNKLGNTTDLINLNSKFDLFEKMSFSCLGCDSFLKNLRLKSFKNILLCGIETHVCIQQTAIDLLNLNKNIYIILDAISSRYKFDHEVAIMRMKNQGIIPSTTESAIFELCSRSDISEFKAISHLIKARNIDGNQN